MKKISASRRVTIGVLCPSVFEFEALKDLPLAPRAAVLLSGMGKVRAAWGVQELRRRHPRLKQILLTGFAGGLKGLRLGDVIEPRLVIEQDYCAEPFEKFPNRVRLKGPRLSAISRSATLLTQDRFLTSNPYRNDRSLSYSRLACDMEAYAVAWTASKVGLSCSILKLISDEADSNADHDFLKACTALRPKLRATILAALSRL